MQRARVSRHFQSGDLRRQRRGAAATCASTSGVSGTARQRPQRSRPRSRAAGFAGRSGGRARLLLELRASALVRRLDEPGRRRLQALVPVLLADVATSSAQLPVLRRVLASSRRSASARPTSRCCRRTRAARARLVELCRHGDFLAAQIAAHPLLLDELIDERLLSQLPDRAAFARDLAARTGAAARGGPGAAGRGAAPVPARGAVSRGAWPISLASAAHAGERPAHRYRRAHRRVRHAARLAADHGAVRGADVRRCGGELRPVQHLRRRLRQARRHGARLLLRSRPGVPARLARRAPGDRRRDAASTTSCSSCASRSASCIC